MRRIKIMLTLLWAYALSMSAQDIQYLPLHDDAAINGKTVDTDLPVGFTAGALNVSPTGGASYTIPIALPPGTKGVVPSLSIGYNSQGGNGIMGMGWNIAGLSAITRTGKNIHYDGQVSPLQLNSNDFYALDGNRLESTSANVYSTKMETFSKITSYGGSADGPDWFKVESKSGITYEYGRTDDAKYKINANSPITISWQLNKTYDQYGNYIEYVYEINGGGGTRVSEDDAEIRLKEINYTGYAPLDGSQGFLPYNKILFNYKNRTVDKITQYVQGQVIGHHSLLTEIVIYTEGSLQVKKYAFEYGHDNIHSFLNKVKEFGSDDSELNATIFKYGNPVISAVSANSTKFIGDVVGTGDFNGDGLQDMLTATHTFDANLGFETITEIQVQLARQGTGLFFTSFRKQITGTRYVKINDNPLQSVFENKKVIVQDFNGDGRDDICTVNETYMNNQTNNFAGFFIYLSNEDGTDFSNDELTGRMEFGTYPSPNHFDQISVGKNFFRTGDFDGDGRTDFIAILKNHYAPFNTKVFLFKPYSNRPDVQRVFLVNLINGTADEWLDAKRLAVLDFDGDGKMEIMVSSPSTPVRGVDVIKHQFFRLFDGTVDYSPRPSVTGTHAELVYTLDDRLGTGEDDFKIGDFNGDGKSDMVGFNKTSNSWYLYKSTGSSLIRTTSNLPFGLSLLKFDTGDFNGDGLSDVVLHTMELRSFGDPSDPFSYRNVQIEKIYFSTGNGFVLQSFEGSTDGNFINVTGDFTLADFNGDGKTDIYGKHDLGCSILYFNPMSKDGTLDKIADGFNQVTEIGYKYLTESGVYSKDKLSTYPLNVVTAPIKVATSVMAPNGIGGVVRTSYEYENAQVHRGGLGFFGFSKFESRVIPIYQSYPPALEGTRTTTEFEIIKSTTTPAHFAVVVDKQTVRNINRAVGLDNELLSETKNNYSFKTNGTRYWQKLDNTSTTSHKTGTTNTAAYTYDDYGNVTTEIANINNIEEVITTKSFTDTYGTTVPAHPETVVVSKKRNDMPFPTESGSILTYNAKGDVTNKIDRTRELGIAIDLGNTEYTYYPTGMLQKSTLTSNGLPTKTTEYEYDDKNRYAIAVINSLQQRAEKTYDARWGSPLKETDITGLTTAYEYDGFGRVKKVTTPQQHDITTEYRWAYEAQKLPLRCYDVITTAPNKPQTWDIYDALGRLVVATHQNYGSADNRGGYTYQVTEYDAKGNVARKSTPVNANNWSNEVEYTEFIYDHLNRLTSETNAIGSTTYAYTFNVSQGQSTVTVTTPAGQTSSKTTDATGKIVSTTDHGGTLTFEYDNRGNQTSVKMDGTVITSMTYDRKGHQKTLTDQSSGTTEYLYDNYGQLTWQKDARGTEYTMNYDDLGRLTSRTGPEGTTTHKYVTSGNGLNAIEQIMSFNGIEQVYKYDEWHRIESATETIDGVAYTKNFTYDKFNNLITTTYPSGLEITNTYDEYLGNLVKVEGNGFKHGSQILFDGTEGETDGFGKWRNYTLGNGAKSNIDYNHFSMPTSYRAGNNIDGNNIQNLDLTWKLTTGNLTSRLDNIKLQFEDFTYDNLNRLTAAQVGGLQEYTFDFNENGNISRKSDVGDYLYAANKPNAVERVYDNDNRNLTLTLETQDVKYTEFQRASYISQGPFELNFMYASDYERRKTELTRKGALVNTRYYLGDYEINVKDGETQYVHYISGGDGLCAIMVKEGTNGAFSYYFPYTDHLGSILTVTDRDANIVAEQNFDAWGRKRNVNTWDYQDVNDVPSWLYRGFTGHEHLPEFGLINMNARLYDPVLGRMLSPDNYVGGGTQGLNRYSYANNNPLNHVDPDGNFAFEIAKFAGHAISTAVGVSLNAIGGKYNHSGGGWQALGDIGVGLANGVLAALNPLDFSFAGDFYSGGVSLKLQSGTDGIGIGVEAGVSLGVGNHRFVEAYAGVSAYSSAIGTNRPTLEGYVGAGIGWKVLNNSDPANGADSYADEIYGGPLSWLPGIMLRSTMYFSGETSQRVGGIAFLFPSWGKQGSVSYENDGVPFGFGAGDNGDSYRTASVNITVWDFEAGFNLFTGYRDLSRKGEGRSATYPFGLVSNPEADMYRAGIAYFGYKGYRAGLNSEQIRHTIQNKFAHGIATQQDWFKITNLYNGAYVRHGQGSRYTNW